MILVIIFNLENICYFPSNSGGPISLHHSFTPSLPIRHLETRLVIHTWQRAEHLKDLHAGHLGKEKTPLRARKTVFWPGISDDIRNAVKACDICQKHKPAKQKEPLMPHDVPSMPWVKLGIDIFEHRSHHYLLVADYFSKFPIVKKLSNQTSSHVIGLLKPIFAEYGIPTIVYTD